MEQIIKDVLKSHGEINVNLGSSAARNVITKEIIEKIKNDDKTEEKRARESWTCSICGKNTYDVEWDYIGSSTNHLGCELENEMKNKKRMKPLDWRKKENPQLELMFDKRKTKGPHHDEQSNSSIPYLPGKYTESVEEPEGTPYSPEEIEAWNRQVEDCGTQQQYDKYRRKLSEEIVDDKSKKYIYESPDGGKTIYKREVHKSEREIVEDFQKEINERKSMVENQSSNELSDRSIEHMKSKYKDFAVKEKQVDEKSGSEEQWSGKYEDFTVKEEQVDERAEKNLKWYKNWKRDSFKNEENSTQNR